MGYSIAKNRHAVMVDGTVMDRHQAGWPTAWRDPSQDTEVAELPLGCRLVDDGTDDLLPVRLRNPESGGWTRVVCTALTPPGMTAGREWLAVLEGPGLSMTVPLTSIVEALGIEEATGALEREAFLESNKVGHHRLHAIPADDSDLPGGLPAWYSVESVSYVFTGPRTAPCPCFSGRPFEVCHGADAERQVSMSNTNSTPRGERQ